MSMSESMSDSLLFCAERDFGWWGDDGNPNLVRWHWFYLLLRSAKMDFYFPTVN